MIVTVKFANTDAVLTVKFARPAVAVYRLAVALNGFFSNM